MALVWLLYFYAVRYSLDVCVVHVPGICNNITDALSHFQMDRFWKLTPNANPSLDSIPAWPMQTFMQAFCSVGIMVLPNPPDVPTTRASPSSSHSATTTNLQHYQRPA